MKQMKSKLIITLSFLLFIGVFGSVYAYMFRQTEIIDNQFERAVVACEVKEVITNNEKNSITIQNTGNIDAYLRLKFVSYWVNSSNEVVGKASEMPRFTISDNWVKGINDTYYYKNKVSSTEFTNNLLTSNISLTTSVEGYIQVVEVFAEAIQADPDNAVTSTWNVTLDANGNIIQVN